MCGTLPDLKNFCAFLLWDCSLYKARRQLLQLLRHALSTKRLAVPQRNRLWLQLCKLLDGMHRCLPV